MKRIHQWDQRLKILKILKRENNDLIDENFNLII